MFRRTASILIAAAVLTTGVAFAQTPPNPTQQTTAAAPQQPVPIFRITVVGRTTPAVNYRPRSGDTKIDFTGTSLLPKAAGQAVVSGEKGYIKIVAEFEQLDLATHFGREYLTYVLWAITPEGRATNLGEIQVDHGKAEVEVTTELQAFGMIITAEPYFAVTQPSDVVVAENVIRGGTKGTIEVVDAKYELLKRGSYLMNHDAAALKLKPIEPGSPLDLAEARNAVELARVAGADQFATDTYHKAARLLTTAEEAKAKKKGGNAIMMPARQAAQTAEDARLIALQKQEEAYRLEQSRLEQARVQSAAETAQAADARRLAAEREKANADQARLAAERERAAADAARLAAENAQRQADAARLAAEAQARDTQVKSEQEKAALREQLRQQLNVILETRETARGLIVNLSDVLFDTASATLKPGAREKLARLSGILLSHPGLTLTAEGHTDSVGTDDYNQRLSEQRAASVRVYLVQQGIAPAIVASAGFGEARPVATNDTSDGRQQNRRVELIVTGDIIGRK